MWGMGKYLCTFISAKYEGRSNEREKGGMLEKICNKGTYLAEDIIVRGNGKIVRVKLLCPKGTYDFFKGFSLSGRIFLKGALPPNHCCFFYISSL